MSKQVKMALDLIVGLIEQADKENRAKGQLSLAKVYLEEELDKSSAIKYDSKEQENG
jgi:hypothetical protein